MSGLYRVYAENLEGEKRFLSKAIANNNGNGLFDLYADECGDEEEVSIVRIDTNIEMMKQEIRDMYDAIPEKQIYTGGYLHTIGRKYITIMDTWNKTTLKKMEIEDFYREYVF